MLPFGGLAQRTIGYTRQTGDTSQGIVGLEHYFNTELEGEKGLVFRKVVSQQTTLPHIERDDVEPDPGLDIHTTLEYKKVRPRPITNVGEKVYGFYNVSQRPTYKGKKDAFNRFIQKNLPWKEDYIEGTIYVNIKIVCLNFKLIYY